MGFWKAFFSSCLGAGVAILFFICLGIIALTGLGLEAPVKVKANSVLTLKFNGSISELEIEDPISELIPEAAESVMGLVQLKSAIAHAKDDENIKGIYLKSGRVGAGITTATELRSSLEDFKKSGKWVVCYSDDFSESGYYVASIADKIYLNPEGMIELNGLAAEVMFFKNLLDKLDIRPQVFRVGEFKSAVEPFLRDDLSEENKLQLNSMLESIYGNMLEAISKSRGIELERVKTIADNMLVRNAKQAKEHELADGLFYEDEVLNELGQRLDLEEDDKINFIAYDDYKKSYSNYNSSKNEIEVIVADGDILQGTSNRGIVGSKTIIEELRKARESERIKAIVLRINSPGGSFHASDEMWREVVLTAEKKTVIASMSDYAASGGYYLAMGCDTIVAQPTTITGSIGVFSILFDMSHFLGNKLGITSDQVKTGEIGNLITVTRSLTDTEKEIWQRQTDEVYETFTGKAADGRRMKLEDLKKIASGRVWTGEQALELGLVDVVGGLNDAINLAATSADIEGDYKVRYVPRNKTFLERFMKGDDNETMEDDQAKSLMVDNAMLYESWKKLKNMQGLQARMPFQFFIY